MKIVRWKKGPNDTGTFVRITQKEAWNLVHSLAGQVLAGDPNSQRAEFETDDGEYFTIAVLSDAGYKWLDEEEKKPVRIPSKKKGGK